MSVSHIEKVPGWLKALIAAAAVLILAQYLGLLIMGGRAAPSHWLLLILVVAAIALLTWTLFSAGKRAAQPLGLSALAALLIFNIMEGGALPLFDAPTPAWQSILGGCLYAALAVLTISAAALLLGNAFRPDVSLFARGISAFLLALLLGLYFYTFVWLAIWDGTDDGLRILLVLMVSVVSGAVAGLALAASSKSWRLLTGLAFAALIPILLFRSIPLSGRYHVNQITEARAARIQQAIQHYRNRTLAYPASLRELVPLDLWRLPRSLIIPGQTWCYQGGPDFYRLGLVYREHWSAPDLSVRVYASAGDVPPGAWECDARLADFTTQTQTGD